MLEYIKEIDAELFTYLNSMRCGFGDYFFWWMSNRFIWIPLYLLLLYMMWKKYKPWFWYLVGVIVLMVLTTDQLGNLFKNGFERLRPTHEPSMNDTVYYLNGYKGGLYSFFSGHSANAFAAAVFTIRMRLNVKHRVLFNCSLLLWAAIVAYSRIYLGVHYPGDLIVGGIIGSLIAWFYSFLWFKILNRLKKRKI